MNLQRLFRLRGVAVIGASPGSYFSDRLFENLACRPGGLEVFPVNPACKTAYKRRCHRAVGDVAGKADAAFLLVEAARAPGLLRECADAGVKTALILDSPAAAGKLGEEIRRIAGKHEMTVLGPACMGYLDTHEGMTMYAGRLPGGPLPRGRVSVVADSGGLLNEFFRAASGERRWGVRRAMSAGQQAAVSAGDMFRFLQDDALTGCVVLLLAGAVDRRGLAAAVEETAVSGKPVVLFPAFLGAGALHRAPDSALFDELFMEGLRRRGMVMLAGSVEEAAEAAGAMAPGGSERAGEGLEERWKRIRGGNVAILSVSGGLGVWAKRRAEDAGLKVPAFGRKTRDGLAVLFPGASFANPVDLSGRILSREASFGKVLRALVRGSGCHAVLATIHVPAGDTSSDSRNDAWLDEMAAIAAETRGERGAASLVPVQVTRAGPAPVGGRWPAASPVFGLDLALKLIAWAGRLGGIDVPADRRERLEALDYEGARAVLRGPARRLSEPSSRKAIGLFGIVFPAWVLASSPSKVAGFVRRVEGPVTMRIATPDAGFDEGGGLAVENVRGEAAARRVFIDLVVEAKKRGEEMRMLGVLVEPFLGGSGDVEASAYSPCDGSPPLLAVHGPAGRAAVGLCPLGPREASHLAQSAAEGLRPPAEPVRLAQLLRRLSFFASDFLDVVGETRCRFAVDGGGNVLCIGVQVVISRTVG